MGGEVADVGVAASFNLVRTKYTALSDRAVGGKEIEYHLHLPSGRAMTRENTASSMGLLVLLQGDFDT